MPTAPSRQSDCSFVCNLAATITVRRLPSHDDRMLGPAGDLALDLFGEGGEVGVVSRHPYREALEVLGVFLCCQQGLLSDDVELDVEPPIGDVRLDQTAL